jgi:hypothetical protein
MADTIIPATVPTYVTVVYISHEPYEERPKQEAAILKRMPVIGWRIDAKYTTPIIPGDNELLDCETVLIELPSGELLDYSNDRGFDSIAQAMTTLLKQAQFEWDKAVKAAEQTPSLVR